MTSDADLLRGIYQLTKGELNGALDLSAPSLLPLLSGCTLVRIEAVADVWSGNCEGTSVSLNELTQSLLCGMYGARLPVLFIVANVPPDISVWIGAKRHGMDSETLRGILRGSYAEIRLSSSARFDETLIADLRHSLIMTGVPTCKLNMQSGMEHDQIEIMCRGLKDKRWLYAVYAEPVLAVEVISQANEAAARIRDVQSTFMLKNSATDHDNRLAQRYVDLLEAQYTRLEMGLSQGMWTTQAVFLTDDAFTAGRAKGLMAAAFGGEASVPQPLRVIAGSDRGKALTEPEQLATQELATLMRLPREDYPGYEVIDYARFGVNVWPAGTTNQRTVQVGTVVDRGEQAGNAVAITLSDFAKHTFVAGVTGSGKTNTCFSLLAQIWDQGNGVPFLVVEPAKSEYRRLLASPEFKGLKVFTVGDETISPLRLNPLAVPAGILVQSHIDYVKALFGASFVLYPPMPYVLEMSLQEIYFDKGWDLASNRNHRADRPTERAFPTLSDLAAKIGEVVDRLGYEERTTMDVKAGLLARVSMLCRGGGKGLMLDTRRSVALDTLFNSPCVLELKQLVSDEEKAFVIGLLLILLYEFNESRGVPADDSIRHVTLIEEAHRLLKNTSTGPGSDVHANPRGMAIQVFANILAEIRSYGEGLIIAEQIPTKLAPDVIKNTNLKIIHRLLAEDDRKMVAAAMNMSEAQTKRLGVLQAGEAVVFSERVSKPVLIRAPLSKLKTEVASKLDAVIARAMAALRATNASLLMKCAGCARCAPQEWTSAACRCGPLEAVDPEVQYSCRRLVNAMRLNKALVWDAFVDFNVACRQSPRQGARSTYCTFVGMVDLEIERRGQAARWGHDDVEAAVDMACAAVHEIHQGLVGEKRTVVEKAAGPSLAAFKNLLERLHRTAVLPYAGCVACPRPCHFRFDGSKELNTGIQQELKDAFLSTSDDLGGFAQKCWTLAGRSFSTKDVTSLRNAALCVGVQQLHMFKQPGSIQIALSRKLAGAMENFG